MKLTSTKERHASGCAVAVITFLVGISATRLCPLALHELAEMGFRMTQISVAARHVSGPVEFYGWWWSNEQQRLFEFDEDSTPMSTYIKLDQWVAGISGDLR